MATIHKRGSWQWQAKVRKKGIRASKTFETKAEAEDWASVIESEIVRGVYVDRSMAERTKFREVIERYIKEEAPRHKGGQSEILRLERLMREESAFVDRTMAMLKVSDFEKYRDKRLEKIKPGSIKRELGLLQIVIEHVRRDMGLLENPVKDVKRPRVNDQRDVRLQPGEEQKLLEALDEGRNPWAKAAVILAIETAMRRGELLELRWEHVDLEKSVAHLPETKNGFKRNVPLSPRAKALLKEMPHSIAGRVLPLSPNALKKCFERARTKAGLEHVNFHDLRHEATSRLFEAGWNIMEVAAVTGHRDLQSLKRYTQLRAEDLAKKMSLGVERGA